jgi:hypothetical protein
VYPNIYAPEQERSLRVGSVLYHNPSRTTEVVTRVDDEFAYIRQGGEERRIHRSRLNAIIWTVTA